MEQSYQPQTFSPHDYRPSEAPVRRPRRRWPKILIGLVIILGGFFAFFYIRHKFMPGDQLSWVDSIPIIGQVKHLAESADRELKGEDDDRINILLLGVGGKGHDGGQLTDTIMIASIKPSTKQVALFSIPRDLAIPLENMGWRKINNVNALAEANEPGSGGMATSQAIGHLLDAPIHYYLRVDFAGFEKIIDEVDGVDVLVENTLDDYSYPILGQEENPNYSARFEHLHVEPGMQHMDGSLALKFARSRHGVGGEGTDFARARRQQKILEAARDELLSANTLLNPKKVTNIFNEVNSNVSTNLKVWEMVKIFGFVKNVEKEHIINKVLDNSPSGLLVDGVGDNGAYILSPRSGDFSEITYLFANLFGNPPSENNSKTENKPKEEVKLTILNGTWINGLGSRVAVDLERDGVTVVEIGNSSRHNFEKSVIYDLSYGAKRSSLEFLKEKTGANIAPTLPDWLKEDVTTAAQTRVTEQPDFILILGTDADANASGVENTN